MSQEAISYLRENKDTYPREVLIEGLRKAGYSEIDIADSAQDVYQDAGSNPIAGSVIANFWDFKTKKIYTTSAEKWKDFLFGIFAPWFFGILSSIIPFVGIMVVIIGEIFALVYLFNRRRFIFYGLLADVIIFPLIGIFILLLMHGL